MTMNDNSFAETVRQQLGVEVLLVEDYADLREHDDWELAVVCRSEGVEVIGPGGFNITIKEEGPTFEVELVVRWQGRRLVEGAVEAEEAEAALDSDLWPTWEQRGYVVDEGWSSDNGWDEDDRCYVRHARRRLAGASEFAEEIAWASEQPLALYLEHELP